LKGISAKRARRQSLIRHEINRHRTRTVRTAIKTARESILSKSDDANETLKLASVALERAGSKGTIHRNNAARRKSRLAKMLNQMNK
jgi:small subunit ribosomal protein S20